MRGALGDDDDGVELDAVAHRDHHDALDVVGCGSDARRSAPGHRASDGGVCANPPAVTEASARRARWLAGESHGGILSPLLALTEALRL